MTVEEDFGPEQFGNRCGGVGNKELSLGHDGFVMSIRQLSRDVEWATA